jgi:phosphoenolpyruvate-protein kinase (PTS system EI component)
MKEYGLDQGDIEVYVMAEIPTNIIRAEDFADVFDGFSIGTNDLTQMTLGVDRNSDKLKDLFDERDPAVKESVSNLITRAHRNDAHVGICGDAPSTHDGYAKFLVNEGIDAISVSPDVALETILKVAEAEENRDSKVPVQVGDNFNKQDVGNAAGEIYETLNKHGSAKASALKNYTSDLHDQVREQALGWLAKEDKVEIDEEEGEIKYKLNE